MVAWPWSKPPLPPPPPPHFIEAHASFVGVLLCIAGPLSCYLLLGPPLKARAPSKQHGRATMTTIDWPRLSVAAAQQSREVFVGCVALFLALRTVLRIATGHTRTAGAVTSGEQVVGDAASLAADVMAYNIVSLAFACSSSALGVFEWLGPIHKVGGTALDRLYGRSPLAERLCRLTAGYECFNLIAVVLLPEYRTAAFIGHHAVTCFLGVLPGVLSMHPWCHYYATFFFGVASLSSVPLCVGELFSAAGLEALVEASKPPFVLLFLLLRTAYWPYVSAGFWQDSLWALAKPRDRAHSLVAYAALLGANVFLTGLQVFWTGQICAAVGEALGQQ